MPKDFNHTTDKFVKGYRLTEAPAGRDVKILNDISQVMANVIGRDARSQPNRLAPVPPTPSAQTRWIDPKPFGARSEQETQLIDALAKKFVGGPNDPVK